MTMLDRLTRALADRYRVTRELGAGGMATVYHAVDLRHDRDVAIKVLHPDLGAALGADRFLGEIRTTARLQHPNILALLDSGEADGLLYYVMPLVDGETLRERLEREKQLPLEPALRIATEVGEALAYAHRQGVIHRDIKPENVLLHDGRPMVADFGIALAVQTAGGQRMTQTGLSLGTPQYMSPEQAMGERTIDARSDVYALGAVTYEMLTGEPPFTGATVQAIVAKVLTERPANPTAVRDTIPRHVEATVLKALAKLPADRWTTAGEFVHALQHAEATATLTTMTAAPGLARPARGASWARVAPWSVAVVALGVAAWALWRTGARDDVPAQPMLVEAHNVEVQQLASLAGLRSFALSRDGTHLAWLGRDSVAATRVFLSTLSRGDVRAIPGTEDALGVALSPDGKSVLFLRSRQVLVVDANGGQPRQIMTGRFSGVTITRDGWIIVAGPDGVQRVRLTGGEPETLVASAADSGAMYSAPHLIEETHTLLLSRLRHNVPDLVALPLDGGGKLTELGISAARGLYLRGVLVFVGPDGILQGVPFDPRSLKTTGDPRIIGETPITMRGSRYDLADNGLLAISTQDATLGELVLVNRSGTARLLSGKSAYFGPRFSPTDARVVVGELSSLTTTREGDLYSIDTATGVKLRVTTDGQNSRPAWTPDGRSLLLAKRKPSNILFAARMPADGTAPATTLVDRPGGIYELALTADGRTLVWREDANSQSTGRDIFAMPVDSPAAMRPIAQTRFNERSIATSPTGDWLAYVSNESGRDEVYIRHLAAGAPKFAVSRRGGEEPRWTRSGEIFFRSGDSVLVSRVTLGARPTDAPRITEPTFLFAARYQLLGLESTWDAAPDGRSFVMVRLTDAQRSPVLLYANWLEAWKRAAAAK
ncbi:MAG: protein kinase [Gemmatimonadaceae bacterium]|nr:protein kinase [Gemmatimonadaceae bacterium]